VVVSEGKAQKGVYKNQSPELLHHTLATTTVALGVETKLTGTNSNLGQSWLIFTLRGAVTRDAHSFKQLETLAT